MSISYHHITFFDNLVYCHSESDQVLLNGLDKRPVLLHMSLQSRHCSPFLHLQVGQGQLQVRVQDGLELLVFPYNALLYH